MFVCARSCVCVCVCGCMYMCICVCAYVCVYVCVYVYLRVRGGVVNMYLFHYMCVNMYNYTFVNNYLLWHELSSNLYERGRETEREREREREREKERT